MGSGDGENQENTEVGEQGVKGEASILKIHIVFIVFSSGLCQTVAGFSVSQKDDVELLGGNQDTVQSRVNPKCIR